MKANQKALKRNSTQFLAVFTLPIDPKSDIKDAKTKYSSWIRSTKATFSVLSLTKYHIPEAETFQLLGQEAETTEKVNDEKRSAEKRLPILHLKSKIKMSVMTDNILIPKDNIPGNILNIFQIISILNLESRSNISK